jgi:hypothetical protein
MAELLVYIDYENMMFEYNVTPHLMHLPKGRGWQSAGMFPNMHDALTEGKRWWNDARNCGFARGSLTLPRKVA